MLCPLARWHLSSALDDRREPSPRVAAHVAGCARCQAYSRRLEGLHGRLSAGAMRAPAAPSRTARRVHRLVAGGALAMAAAAALFYLVGTREGAPSEPIAATAVEDDVPAEVAAPPHRHSSRRDVVDRLSVVFTAPAALRDELDALADDGRRGALAILDLGGVR